MEGGTIKIAFDAVTVELGPSPETAVELGVESSSVGSGQSVLVLVAGADVCICVDAGYVFGYEVVGGGAGGFVVVG